MENHVKIEKRQVHTVVVGSGAAGLNAAHELRRCGVEDMVLVTENMNFGTSRNTGSDKQTYYKLSLSGEQPDSVRSLARVLYDGGCVDGDHALCEAALSVQGFFKLVELGVPFPHDTFGEYVGYKTDHDLGARGTSAGPYTSRYMTEALEKAVKQEKIPIYDHCQVIQILSDGEALYGILCLDTEKGNYILIRCTNVVYATGGPAGMYGDSVYPASQLGSGGIAFEAGVLGKNLTEWQYGLASVKPRWNVSGSYMQVLPRFVSTDKDGGDQREFLMDFYETRENMLDMVFFKGYQWPFDARKVSGGSSMIDLLVYRETCVNKRRVWLDYRTNPGEQPIDFDALSKEAADYLRQADACLQTPYERLCRLNGPAAAFYKEHGVDLKIQMLEVAVCAQHNNGGLSVDAWWQTNVKGFFAVGEAAGTHGIYRPGGSALNAGQAGAARAAEFIAVHKNTERQWSREEEERFEDQAERRIAMGEGIPGQWKKSGAKSLSERWKAAARQMSRCGAMLRDRGGMEQMVLEIHRELEEMEQAAAKIHREPEETEQAATEIHREPGETEQAAAEFCRRPEETGRQEPGEEEYGKIKEKALFYHYFDMRLCQNIYLEAMLEYIRHGGKSRGSAIYLEEEKEDRFRIVIPQLAAFSLDGPDGRAHQDEIQEILYDRDEKDCRVFWRAVRRLEDIPDPRAFEVVWKAYREKRIYTVSCEPSGECT